ncbi:hypothetical protein Q1695_006072 [Nippostrongylus brasiliensis]|nr:hypothetical protein Q1695_006072 [Nippostrongylus brasiliensis]
MTNIYYFHVHIWCYSRRNTFTHVMFISAAPVAVHFHSISRLEYPALRCTSHSNSHVHMQESTMWWDPPEQTFNGVSGNIAYIRETIRNCHRVL